MVGRQARLSLLRCEPVEVGHILERCCGPTVCAVSDVCRRSFVARDLNEECDQTLLARVMHLRQTHNCDMHALFCDRLCRLLGTPRNRRNNQGSVCLRAHLAGCATDTSNSRGDDEQLAWLQR